MKMLKRFFNCIRREFLPFTIQDPKPREVWKPADGNPFSRRSATVLEVRQGWVHYYELIPVCDYSLRLSSFKRDFVPVKGRKDRKA